MKTMTELKSLDADSLNDELLSLRKTAFNLRLKKSSGSLEKTHLIKQVRRDIARV